MRDPDRIEPMLAALCELWKRYPDMRLTQLIANVCQGYSSSYVMEDDEVWDRILNPFWESSEASNE